MFKRWKEPFLVLVIALALPVVTLAHGDEGMPYHVTLEAQTPSAEEPFTLSLNIVNHDDTPVSEFDVVHDKLLHLIVVSDDLTEFLHVHPEYQGEGVFVLDDAVLPRAANYALFADFTPTGDTQQVVRLNLATLDAEEATAELVPSPQEVTVEPLKVKLDLPAELKAGEDVTLGFHITDAATGEPVDTLDEYLGAAGHLVILDQSVETYLHTHPEHDEHAGHTMNPKYGPDIEFTTQFPEIGSYAMWLQVQYQGEIYTAPFVIEITEEAEESHGSHQH